MRGDRAALAQFADSLVGRGLKADLRDGEARGVGEGGLHLGEARLDARALRDEGQIDVGGLQAAGPQFRTDPLQQQLGVDPAIGGVGVRKKVPDVRQAGGPEEGVAEGVREAVGVAVTLKPEVRLEADASEDERAPRGGAVDVVAVADARNQRDSSGRARESRNST